jgi:hypothetical protein
MVQSEKPRPRLLQTALFSRLPAGPDTSSPGLSDRGRLTFIASMILVTVAFSVGFYYLLETRWSHHASKPVSSTPVESPAAEQSSFGPVQPSPLITQSPLITTPAPAPLRSEMFRVTSIALGETRLAIINGKRLAEGESLLVRTPEGSRTVQVVKIDDGVVYLTSGSEKIEARLTPPSADKPLP